MRKKISFFLIMMIISVCGIMAQEVEALYQNPFPPVDEVKVEPQEGDMEVAEVPWLVLRNALFLRETYIEAHTYIDDRLDDLKEDSQLIGSLTTENTRLSKDNNNLIGLSVGLGITVVVISAILIFK